MAHSFSFFLFSYVHLGGLSHLEKQVMVIKKSKITIHFKCVVRQHDAFAQTVNENIHGIIAHVLPDASSVVCSGSALLVFIFFYIKKFSNSFCFEIKNKIVHNM